MGTDTTNNLAAALVTAAETKNTLIATAESCTGGLIAGAITEIPGSSTAFDRGFVTYTNEAKTEMLGVPSSLIASKGAVSEEVAAAMAEGALENSRAGLTVSVTGIAGPTGGTAEKPVGLVCFGLAQTDKKRARIDRFLMIAVATTFALKQYAVR